MPTGNISPSRRHVLRQLSLFSSGLLTGCFSPQMGGSIADISIYNATEDMVKVSLKIYRLPEQSQVLADDFTLKSGTSHSYSQPFTEDGRKRLEITVNGNRRTSYEWTANAESGSTGLNINIEKSEFDINQVSS